MLSTQAAEVEDIRLQSKTTSFEEIPVVDISALIDNSNTKQVAQEIGDICENVGFLYIKNHGIPQELIDKAYDMAKQLFDLPLEVKEKYNIVNSGQTLRGYIGMYGENVDPENTRDFKECFDYGTPTEEVSPFFGPNPMPTEVEGFKEVMEEYHRHMLDLSRKLVGAIALSLDLPEDYFARLQTNPINIQRILHYPPQQGEIRQEEIGIGAHTDYGFLTILAQDDVGGLQVKNRDGDWISAPPIDGTFIVNIGDFVQTFTNDRYISTVHRVINRSGRERYSIPFFLDMDFDAEVAVLPNCQSEDNPARYESYKCGEHKYRRFVASYTHLQAANQS